MGMYVCLEHLERYELRPSFGSGYLQCEICLPLSGDQTEKWTNFTWDLTRLGERVPDQLKRHITRATEVGWPWNGDPQFEQRRAFE